MKPRPDKATTQAWLARRASLMARLESRYLDLDRGLSEVEQRLRASGLAELPVDDESAERPRKPR